jgi:aspartate kinase
MVNVLKPGGSSLASRELIEHFLLDCVAINPDNKYLIVSAPGKKNICDKAEKKVTDLLKEAAEKYPGRSDSIPLRYARERFSEIYPDFPDIQKLFDNKIFSANNAPKVRYEDQIALLGELVQANGVVRVANKLGIKAVLALPEEINFILESDRGYLMPNPLCYPMIKSRLDELTSKNPNSLIIIPGYYGAMPNGFLATMERGASDITGSVISRAINAEIYENWTDFSLHVVDPKKVPNDRKIDCITREEVTELGGSGEFKLNHHCLIPLEGTKIPIEVKNTREPREKGTLVLDERIINKSEKISGITYKENLLALEIRKPGMDSEIGFGENLLRILRENNISYRHSPTGVDRMAVILDENQIANGRYERISERLEDELGPLKLSKRPISIVGVAGLGMRNYDRAAEDVLSALREKGIRHTWPGIGSSDISFFVGIEGPAQPALEALYKKFYG